MPVFTAIMPAHTVSPHVVATPLVLSRAACVARRCRPETLG
jgi:hypothetical protein